MQIKSICVIGGNGSMGSKHVKRLQEQHPELDIFIEDPVNTWVNAKYESTQDDQLPIQNGGDAYIIATPSDTHYEIAKYHLEKGHHVLLEKPITLEYEQAKELYAIAYEKDIVFLAGHTQRFNPVFTRNTTQEAVYQMIEGYLLVNHVRPEENIVFDLMIHLIELACYLTDYCNREDIEIIEVSGEQDNVTAIFALDETICNFTVAYGVSTHMRSMLIASDKEIATIDLLAVDKEPTDSLQHMHQYFIDKCNENKAIDHAKYGVQSIKIVEEINSFLVKV